MRAWLGLSPILTPRIKAGERYFDLGQGSYLVGP